MEEVDMIGALFSHFPWLRFVAPEMSGYKAFLETHQELWAFVQVSEYYVDIIELALLYHFAKKRNCLSRKS